MTRRRLLPLLALLALVVAPFGRMAAAEAMTPAHHAAMGAPAHCDDAPASEDGDADEALDCLNACASLAAAHSNPLRLPMRAPAVVEALAPAEAAGIHPEAEPPPPRSS